MGEVVTLEDEVDVVGELDTLTVGQRQQAVIVQNRVQTLDPLRIDVTIANDPGSRLEK